MTVHELAPARHARGRWAPGGLWTHLESRQPGPDPRQPPQRRCGLEAPWRQRGEGASGEGQGGFRGGMWWSWRDGGEGAGPRPPLEFVLRCGPLAILSSWPWGSRAPPALRRELAALGAGQRTPGPPFCLFSPLPPVSRTQRSRIRCWGSGRGRGMGSPFQGVTKSCCVT